MFNWVERLIVKSVVKKILKKLPKSKEKALGLVEVYGDDIVEKVFQKAEQVVLEFAEKH